MQQRNARGIAQVRTLLLIVAMTMIAGCQGLNPFAAAETIEQQAFAVEASYNIALQTAVDLVADPAVPQSAKDRILATEKQASEVVETLADATDEYLRARALFEAGMSNEQKLTLVANNLEQWILRAESAIGRLSTVIKDVGD